MSDDPNTVGMAHGQSQGPPPHELPRLRQHYTELLQEASVDSQLMSTPIRLIDARLPFAEEMKRLAVAAGLTSVADLLRESARLGAAPWDVEPGKTLDRIIKAMLWERIRAKADVTVIE